MFETVAIPVWAFFLIGLFAALSILERIVGPSVRWFLRRRAERVVAELNKRLDRPIEPFKLARRHDMIQRLRHDPEVAKAVVEHARMEDTPEEVASKLAERYAREIVPSFSATAYFGFGTRAARWLSDALFDVQLDQDDDEAMAGIDTDATVVFVINHRSNTDYVLVTWLAAKRSALSYAVGEWARIWPLSALIRTMGAYFIRRRTPNPLYRKVLARYVQLATAGGVTQAVFPEGGLSLDGRLAPLKLGLISYIVAGHDPDGRDVVFVPVALNYDRIIEDRILTAAHAEGTRKFRASIPTGVQFAVRQLIHRLRGRLHRFGNAAVSYGTPVSLVEFSKSHPVETTEKLAEVLSERLNASIPLLAVPLIAETLKQATAPIPREDLVISVIARANELKANGARLPFEPGAFEKAIETGLKNLLLRRLIQETEAGIAANPQQLALIAFYANSIRHLDRGVSDPLPVDQS